MFLFGLVLVIAGGVVIYFAATGPSTPVVPSNTDQSFNIPSAGVNPVVPGVRNSPGVNPGQ